ncbi:MAG: PfkB family carbohydrate kinase, partial [Planctomycetes bacterium]|nr:PfkB family carbohydrate kinase [Planctomycetota bacterium]
MRVDKASNSVIDVLGLGAVTVDFVGTVPAWPDRGVKMMLDRLTICDGGLVGTALVAVSRLGGKAAFAAKLGQSEMARRAVDALRRESIDTSFVIETQDAEPIVALILIDRTGGQRNIFWTRHHVQYPMPGEFPDPDWLARTRVLMIDFESGQAGIEAARIARRHRIPVVIDVEQNESHVAEAMRVSSHIIVSEDFAGPYTGRRHVADMRTALRSDPEQVVIITRGEKGCVGSSSAGDFALPAFKVDVVDTTGCGDTFHGAKHLRRGGPFRTVPALPQRRP